MVRFLPPGASAYRVGDIVWRGIRAGGKLEARAGGRAWHPAVLQLLGEDRLRVEIRANGARITQSWARKGSEAEERGRGAGRRPSPP